eukprot:scaffold25864_cov140-Isochrysis_galbana.AAC.1
MCAPGVCALKRGESLVSHILAPRVAPADAPRTFNVQVGRGSFPPTGRNAFLSSSARQKWIKRVSTSCQKLIAPDRPAGHPPAVRRGS